MPFDRLIDAKYVGSPRGSSLAELKAAAKDNGLEALEIHHFKNLMLYDLRKPTLLHVRSRAGGREFNHWVLLSGIEDGAARICDGFDAAKRVGFGELTEIWDGDGLVVSDGPISTVGVSLTAASHVMLYMTAGLIFVLALGQAQAVLRRPSGEGAPGSKSSLPAAFGEAISILILTAAGAAFYRGMSPEGFLSSPAATAAIQNSHIFVNFKYADFDSPVVSGTGADRLLVDARLSSDYSAGHLPGAVNIPPTWTVEQCKELLGRLPKATTIVIYCQSIGCPFGKVVGKRIDDLGYNNIYIYKGGYFDWTRHRGRPGSSTGGKLPGSPPAG